MQKINIKIMTAKELAEKLNGREYPFSLNEFERKKAKESGLVIVYGASDDLMEFDGAIDDEISSYNGTIAYITKKGKIVEDEDDRELLIENEIVFNEIEAVWAPDELNCSWLMKTDLPHETFYIFEDRELYCRGIVFSINDLK